jgi:hypothetical protein
MAQANAALAGPNATPGSVSGAAKPIPGSGTTPDPNDPNTQLAALLKPTPGGTVIHYKVE